MNGEAKLTPTFVDCIIRGDVINAELYIKNGSIANAKTIFKGRKSSMVEIAIQNDDIDMIKLLLNKGATIPTDYKAEEYLFSHGLLQVDPSKIIRASDNYAKEASKNPESQYAKFIFELLGESYSSYLDSNPDMSNALSTAIKNGDTEMINFFIEKKVKLRLCHIVSACHNGSVELVRYLLDNGAPLQEGSISALAFPCQNGQLDIVKLLLSKGANVNTGRGKVLNSACIGGNIEIIELLLKSGADPNIAPLIDGYPIEIAASVGRIDIIEKLFSYGAELKNKGREAIIAAASNGHINVFNYLADMGVDVKENLIVLMNAASENGHIEIVKVLVDLIPEGEHYKIAANIVKGTKHPEIVQFFIDKGFDIMTHQLLEQAVRANHVRVVQLLLDNGLKVKEVDLYWALEKNNYELVELLLKNFNCKNYEVHLYLHNMNNKRMINLLERYGIIIVSTDVDLWYYFIQNEKYENIARAIVNGFNHKSLYNYLDANCCIPKSIMYSIESFIDPYSVPSGHEIIGTIQLEEIAIMYPILKDLYNEENFWI